MQDIAKTRKVAACLTWLAIFGGPATGAFAQSAAPCTGTLCDLYYGASGSNNAASASQPAAPTPLTVSTPSFSGFSGITNLFSRSPSTPAPSGAAAPPATAAAPSTSLLNLNGGGLLAPKTDQRCGGTLCDMYYGVAGEPAPQAAREATATPRATAIPSVGATATGYVPPPSAPAPAAQRRIVESVQRQTPPACVGTAHDPWQCFRK